MSWKEAFVTWKEKKHSNAYISENLEKLTDEEAKEQFKKHLDFGTGGARGMFGAGTNRINHYTMRRLSQGLLNYLEQDSEDAKSKSIAVNYDTRYFSRAFALDVAYLFASNGFKVYLSDEARPTPLLSYMIRKYKTAGGVMITASHNPPNYNGFKIYDETGGQMTEDMAAGIVDALGNVKDELNLPSGPIDLFLTSGLIVEVDDAMDQSYLSDLRKDLLNPEVFGQAENFSVVYSPLHGAGLHLIEKAFNNLNFSNYHIVEEQTTMTGAFETVAYPNPEERQAFKYAERLGLEKKADLIMATDPDADRLGVAVYNGDNYRYLNGNELGAILLQYLMDQKEKKSLENSVLIKTIVTSDLGKKMVEKNGGKVLSTLTGFKYIGEKITELENVPNQNFLFGYEESYGYLFSPIVRDKDAVQAVVLLIEAALYYQQHDQTLVDVLRTIHKEYGYYKEELITVELKAEEDVRKIEESIRLLKSNLQEPFGDFYLAFIEDYNNSIQQSIDGSEKKLTLPKSNVLKLIFSDGSWIAIRPSGTEPKYKFYLSTHSKSKDQTERKLNDLKEILFKRLSL